MKKVLVVAEETNMRVTLLASDAKLLGVVKGGLFLRRQHKLQGEKSSTLLDSGLELWVSKLANTAFLQCIFLIKNSTTLWC